MNNLHVQKNVHLPQIPFATPIASKDTELVQDFIINMGELGNDINQSAGQDIIPQIVVDLIGKRESEYQSHNLLNIQILDIAYDNPKINMAYWWYKSVHRAFSQNPNAKAVFYYPFDVSWQRNSANTISTPAILIPKLNEIQHEQEECFWLGGYTSPAIKDAVEDTIRHRLQTLYPHQVSATLRVRSEFWAITPQLFSEIEHFFNSILYNVSDPSLFILLYCLKNNRTIKELDLGFYRQLDIPQKKDAQRKLERALNLIENFL